jgi:hypothetical protein
VSRSYVQLIKTHPAEGWVKARYVKTTEDLEKINRMHEHIHRLEKELEQLRALSNEAMPELAREDDVVILKYEYSIPAQDEEGSGLPGFSNLSWRSENLRTTWNAIFEVIALVCIDGGEQSDVEFAIGLWIRDQQRIETHGENPRLDRDSLIDIKVQFLALNYIRIEGSYVAQPGQYQPSYRGIVSWVLTDFGGALLANLRGTKRLATL